MSSVDVSQAALTATVASKGKQPDHRQRLSELGNQATAVTGADESSHDAGETKGLSHTGSAGYPWEAWGAGVSLDVLCFCVPL